MDAAIVDGRGAVPTDAVADTARRGPGAPAARERAGARRRAGRARAVRVAEQDALLTGLLLLAAVVNAVLLGEGGRQQERVGQQDARRELGGAVGALTGAAIAEGEGCERFRRRRDVYYGDDPYYRDEPYRDDPYYDGGYRDDPYYGDSRRYSTRDDELAGGPDYRNEPASPRRQSRTYSAPQTVSASCRYMTTSGRQVYMCQGADGIWRPAQ